MYLTNETDYIVWSRVSSSIAYVRDMLSSDTVVYLKFQVRNLSYIRIAKLTLAQILYMI